MQERFIDLVDFTSDIEDTLIFDMGYPNDSGKFRYLFEQNVLYSNAVYEVIQASFRHYLYCPELEDDPNESIALLVEPGTLTVCTSDYQRFLENYLDEISLGMKSENLSAKKIFQSLAMAANDILDILIATTQ